MNVIVAGCGKAGYAIAKSLAAEAGVNITIIDKKMEALEKASDTIDALLIKGSCMNINQLIEAGVQDADLIISVTNADEANILCCVIAKRLGTKHTIARVSQPDFAVDTDKYWKDIGLDMTINPEQEAAREISRLLRFPAAVDIDTFLGGRVELISFKVSDASDFFTGKSVAEVFSQNRTEVLLTLIQRGDTVIIPKGDVVFEEIDIIRLIGRPAGIMDFFALIGKNTGKVKSASIIGGSKITYYLVSLLHKHTSGINIKIIELSREKCEDLSEKFPRCLIIHGDGTDEGILTSEVINKTEAVLCLTNRDEENAVIALYSNNRGFRKTIVKIDHINQNLVRNLPLGSIISPKNLMSEHIVRYVRGLSNAAGSGVKKMYTLFRNDEDSVEASEFVADENSKCVGVQLKDLKLNKWTLIACIVRNSKIIIPTGASIIQAEDTVIVISKNEALLELDDILSSFMEF